MYSFSAGLKKNRTFCTAFPKIRRKAAEKPAFEQLLYRAAFNFRKGRGGGVYVVYNCFDQAQYNGHNM